MAKLKPFSSLGKDMEVLMRRVDKLAIQQVRRVAIAVGSGVIVATPVDTGRARGNWLSSLGTPVSVMNWDGSAGFGAESSISRLRSIASNYHGGSLFVANNLPYINRLNNGWSKQQAVPGWIERISSEVFDTLKGRWWHK